MDATLLLGPQVGLVNEQLFYAANYTKMIDIVETYLLKLAGRFIRDAHPIDVVAMMMLNPVNHQRIEWYADQSNLCYRQFDRLFKDRTGITPKDYTSLIRLDYAYLLKNRYPQDDWLKIAIHSGFYDYQHLSRHYKRYIGFSPREFYGLEMKAPERHFGDYER